MEDRIDRQGETEETGQSLLASGRAQQIVLAGYKDCLLAADTDRLTVGRPAPQTCPPRSGSPGMKSTPPASWHSPPHQTSGGSGSEIHCSFALDT